MGIRAGKQSIRLLLQGRVDGTDDWGDPIKTWQTLGEFSAEPKNETGMGAIRSALQGGVPASIARYSFKVRAFVLTKYGVSSANRLVNKIDGTVFSVTGAIRDYADPSQGYIMAEVGGNEG